MNFTDKSTQDLEELMIRVKTIGEIKSPLRQLQSYLDLRHFLEGIRKEGYTEGFEDGLKKWEQIANN